MRRAAKEQGEYEETKRSSASGHAITLTRERHFIAALGDIKSSPTAAAVPPLSHPLEYKLSLLLSLPLTGNEFNNKHRNLIMIYSL